AARAGQVPGEGTSPGWQGLSAPGQGDAGFGTPPPPGAQPPGGQPAGSPGRGQNMGAVMSSPQAADARGFIASLFDFRFTSFVTTKIIKVLYVLITVLVVLTWLGYTALAFRGGAVAGFLVLLVVGPLSSIIVL